MKKTISDFYTYITFHQYLAQLGLSKLLRQFFYTCAARRQKVLYVLLMLSPLFIASCSVRDKSNITTSTNEGILNNSSYKLVESDFTRLFSTLNQVSLGKGKDVLGIEDKDRPMAYSLILSALSNYHQVSQDDVYITEIRNCGYWLINNSDIDRDGIYGFGLPEAWDAFGDGSVNPPHNEYTITTAIAIKGLLDWLDADSEAPQEEINSTINLLLQPYLSGLYNSPSGLYAYSLNENDLKYDVFNPAAFLAGQMQRYSQIAEHNSEDIQSEADRIIDLLVQNHLVDIKGNWFWNYGVLLDRLERPNDLVHAVYIIEGMREYIKNNGRKKRSLQWSYIRDHIFIFLQNQIWCERFDISNCNTKHVRLWAIGMLLYLFSTEPNIQDIYTDTLLRQLEQYKDTEGVFRDPDQYVRHDAHLLLGMSYYLFKDDQSLK